MADVDSLARVLDFYDVALDRSQLRAALEDEDFSKWATTHLHSDNLLTIDELSLYTVLDRAGHVDTLVAGKDLAEVQGLEERDLRSAIAALERSTDAITTQTEALRKQQAAVAKLAEQCSREASQRADLEQRRRHVRELERKRVQTELDNIVRAMGFRISDFEQQTKASGTAIQQTVDTALQGDDRLLASLQKLGWELVPDDPEEDQAVKALREICMRLIKTSVETIRTKLDRVFLETLASDDSASAAPSAPLAEEIKATQDEIESLYLEILPVAQMAVEQHHLEPALKSVSAGNIHRLGRSTAAVAYIHSCLDHLMERSRELTSRIEAAQAHQSACQAILTTTRDELERPTAPTAKHTRNVSSTSAVFPTRTRSRAHTVSTPLPTHRRGASTASTPEDTDPLAALLAPLAITLPTTTTPSTTGTEPGPPVIDTALAVPLLRRVLAERTHATNEVAHATTTALMSGIATQLGDARGALQLLRDSVLAESAFGPGPAPGLVDPGIEASLGVLGDEVRRAGEAVAAAEREMDAGALVVSERRDRFVERWGG